MLAKDAANMMQTGAASAACLLLRCKKRVEKRGTFVYNRKGNTKKRRSTSEVDHREFMNGGTWTLRQMEGSLGVDILKSSSRNIR